VRTLAVLALVVACGGGSEPVAVAPNGSAVARSARDAAAEPQASVFVGVVAAAESVDIAPRAAGVIAKVYVASGDTVRIGDVVAEMDPVQLREEVRAAEGALGAATAAYRQALVEVEDARRKLVLETKSVEQGVSPRTAREDAAFAVKRAEAAAQKAASTQAAEASRTQTAKDHLSDAQLRAPFEGTVALRFRDAGNRIDAGTAIIRIVGHGGMRLRFAVPPDRVQAVGTGTRVTATIDTVGTPVVATVKQVSPTIDSASGMVIVEAQLPSDGSLAELRSGLAARVTL
jgi:RND family efflux transporter MFP subunit